MGASKACNSPYESARNQRVEQNKRRLKELGLTELSRDLSTSAAPTRTSPGPRQGRPRVLKEKVTVQLRRSTRNAGGEQPDYVEVEIDIRRRARFDNTGGTRHYSRLYERKYASDEARLIATEKAEALKKTLPQTHGSFVKPMLQSHVTGGFWLGLPVTFCRDYLPKKDDRIVLEDENNEEWETIYLSKKTGLSGGWRGFSLDHGLVDGDALVFELVEYKRFKVHIIRVYGTNKAEAQLESDVKEEGTNEAAEKASSNKVRQKLIWETKPEKGIKREENKESDVKTHIDETITADGNGRKRKERSDDEDVGVDIKSIVHLENSCGIVKEEMGCGGPWNEDVKNVELHCIKADIKDSISSKTLKIADTNITVKREKESTSVDDVKNACLFDTSGGKQFRDITSYMRSKKHTDVNVKKEMQTEISHFI